jgi:hypothetical protein
LLATFFTVVAAGLLGGAIAADITVVGVVAVVALIAIGFYNGFSSLVDVCELRRDKRP